MGRSAPRPVPRPGLRPALRRVRALALRLLVPALTQTIGRLPYPALEHLARGLARLLLATNKRYRDRSLRHLEIAFPQAGAETLYELRRGTFLNAALNAMETLQLLARGRRAFDERLVVEGWENVEREAGRRLLLLSCHSGFWELLGAATARRELPLYAIGRRPDEPAFGEIVRRVRRAVAVHNIERGTADGRRLLRKALKGEGALAIFIDQDTRVDGTWVPFFGRDAHTPTGAAEMALRHDMRVIPSFLERRAHGVHAARFLPALELPADVTQATAVMSAAIEAHIRRHPEQWVWWHKRWRRRPPAESAESPVEPAG